MTDNLNRGRRRFLGTAIALAGFSFWRGTSNLAWPFSSPGPRESMASALVATVGDPASARAIGLEYLASAPHASDARGLVDAICDGDDSFKHDLARSDVDALRRALAVKQRQDFEYGRVVRLRSWILSDTEVRLCALVALT